MATRSDNFNRSNAALGGSTPSDGGSAWTTAGVGANIVSNQVKWTATAGPGLNLLETSVSDGTVSAKLVNTGDTNIGSTMGLAFRYADTSNYWYASIEWVTPRLGLFKRVAGTTTQVGSYYTGSINAGDVLSVSFVGDQITVKLNGTTVIGPRTDSALQTNTKVGLRNNGDQVAIYDDFSFSDVAAPSVLTPTKGAMQYAGKVAGVSQGFGSITVTEINEYRVFQRTVATENAAVTLSGTFTVSAASVQARILDAVTSAVIVDWTTIDASPGGGTFSGSITVPQGGWYVAQVRKGDATGVTDTQAQKWGVGALIAFTGQSNARNMFSSTGSAYSNDLLVFWSASTSTHSPTGQWKPLTDTSYGGIGFGDAFTAVLPIPVGFIDTGVGSSSAASWQSGQANYEAFEAAVDANGSAFEAQCWMQGEAEATSGGTESGYEDDVYNDAISVIKQSRADFTNPTPFDEIPFFIALLARGTVFTDTNAANIRKAQRDVIDADADVFLGATTYDNYSDGVHYNSAAYQTIGARLAQSVLHRLGLVSYSRGPKISHGVQVNSTTLDIYVAHQGGGSDISPSSGIAGFEVFDDGSPLTISSAVRQTANSVRLTVTPAIAGVVTARYAYGADAGATFANTFTGALKDNSALALPAEHIDSIPIGAGNVVVPSGGALVYSGNAGGVAQPAVPITVVPTISHLIFTGRMPTVVQSVLSGDVVGVLKYWDGSAWRLITLT